MVGATLAAALQQTTFQVALIDAAPAINPHDPRLIGLNHRSYQLLKKLNLWESLAPQANPIQQIHVSHRGHFGITRIAAEDLNVATLGFVVPAKHINTALYASLIRPNVTLLQSTQLKSFIEHDDHITLETLMNGKNTAIDTRMVIAADGTHSTVRTLLNIPTKIHDYQQSAIVTITELTRSHQHIAYERFLSHGAIAMLPLPQQRCATIWTDETDHITALQKLSDEAFLTQLQKHFGYRLGRFKQIQQRFVFPLTMEIATQQVHNKIILLGNAAHTLYPVASQGLNLAWYEVEALLKQFLAITSLTEFNTQHYLDSVQSQQTISKQLSHHLSWLFSTDFPLMTLGRKLGLIGFDICSFAKKKFAKRAIGTKGNSG